MSRHCARLECFQLEDVFKFFQGLWFRFHDVAQSFSADMELLKSLCCGQMPLRFNWGLYEATVRFGFDPNVHFGCR